MKKIIIPLILVTLLLTGCNLMVIDPVHLLGTWETGEEYTSENYLGIIFDFENYGELILPNTSTGDKSGFLFTYTRTDNILSIKFPQDFSSFADSIGYEEFADITDFETTYQLDWKELTINFEGETYILEKTSLVRF